MLYRSTSLDSPDSSTNNFYFGQLLKGRILQVWAVMTFASGLSQQYIAGKMYSIGTLSTAINGIAFGMITMDGMGSVVNAGGHPQLYSEPFKTPLELGEEGTTGVSLQVTMPDYLVPNNSNFALLVME